MKKILLFPFNGNTKEAVSVIEAINAITPKWHILGFLDDDPEKKGSHFAGYKVLGTKNILATAQDYQVLAAPGRPENYLQRKEIVQSLNLKPERFATIIHPSAQIGTNCTIGRNCLIMANVVLTSCVILESNVVILPNTVISHDSTVHDWTILGSNISISGNVSIGENCYIGTGSKIINDISIGAGSMVGIGSVVIRNIPASSIVAGNPAKDLNEN